jgi:radical SAM protein with 4Fe4S-binding SPASM domain
VVRNLFSSLLPLTFDWIQVEVTSVCNAACFYCPRTAYQDRWINRHMTLATFAHVVPALKQAKLAYLQGWGEPFLNPDFFVMVEQAKKAGCLVGTTTNGMVLDAALIGNIIRSGLDILSFSLAHTDPCHDHVRQGTHLTDVLDRIREVTEAKKRTGTDKPAIHVAYLLLRSNKDDVKRLPSLLKGLGVDQAVVSTLDFVPTPELEKEELLPRTEAEYEELQSFLENVRIEGELRGVPIHYQIGYAGRRRLFCSENIEKAVVISASGEVSPCVLTNIPVAAGQTEEAGPTERMIFGNITQQPLSKIWRSDAYKKFRRSIYDQERHPSRCMHCSKLYLT